MHACKLGPKSPSIKNEMARPARKQVFGRDAKQYSRPSPRKRTRRGCASSPGCQLWLIQNNAADHDRQPRACEARMIPNLENDCREIEEDRVRRKLLPPNTNRIAMMSAKGEAEARSGSRRHCFIVGAHFPTNRQIEHLANGAADPICPDEFLDWARTRYESAVNVASLAYLVHMSRAGSGDDRANPAAAPGHHAAVRPWSQRAQIFRNIAKLLTTASENSPTFGSPARLNATAPA